MAATITGPKTIILPASLGGNDADFQLASLASVFGLKVDNLGDTVRLAGITDWTLFGRALVASYLAKGCEVEGYPVFFAVSDMSAQVPANFPNRTYLDGEEVEQVHTWATWSQVMPTSPVTVDAVTYVSSNDPYSQGEPLPASVWSASGVTVVNVPEYQAILAG